MEKPKISIIVPIYNMEKYLRECLESIQAQTFTDWECILVDDGSIDSSPSICDEFAAKDPRFKVIHKTNGGLSSARNAALKVAKGDLIGFVDSDDWIEPGMYQLLFNLISEHNADIAQVGYIKEYIGRRSTKHIIPHTKIISGKEAILDICFDKIPNYVWNKLQRRSIITCEFPEGRNFEDIYVYSEWLKNVNRMVLDPTPMYHYRMRAGSIIHSNVAKNRYDYFLSCIDQMNMINHLLIEENEINHKNGYINRSAVGASKMIARFENDKTVRKETISKISNEVKCFPLQFSGSISLKNWWRAKLLRTQPSVFTALMRGVHLVDFDMRNREKRYYD